MEQKWANQKKAIRELSRCGFSFVPVPHTPGTAFVVELWYEDRRSVQKLDSFVAPAWGDAVHAAIIEALAWLCMERVAA